MDIAVIPTRGSNRVVRKDWIQKIAPNFDAVFVLARDCEFGSYVFPRNVTVIETPALSLPEKRQLGMQIGQDCAAEWVWELDDDLESPDWNHAVMYGGAILRAYPWVASVSLQNSILIFFQRGSRKSGDCGNGTFPDLRMMGNPQQAWALRVSAWKESSGFYLYTPFEDLEMGYQLSQRGWVHVAIDRVLTKTTRPKNINSKRDGGIIPSERLEQSEPAAEYIRQAHFSHLKSFKISPNSDGVPSAQPRYDWKEACRLVIERWGLDADLRSILATRNKELINADVG